MTTQDDDAADSAEAANVLPLNPIPRAR